MKRKKNKNLSINIQSVYLKEVQRISLLTEEEEFELGKRIKMGDEKAVKKLVFYNLRLVTFIARWYELNYALYNGINKKEFLDICEEGSIGLIKAAKKFDITKNCRFSTIAVPYIHREIQSSLSKEGLFKVTIAMNKEYQDIEKVKRKLKNVLEITPSLEEIEKEMQISKEKIEEIQNIFFPLEYEDSLLDESKISKHPNFICEDLEEKMVELLDAKEEISSCLSLLKERDRQIIEFMYGINGKPALMPSEIAKIFHITKTRVHQIKYQSFETIRNHYQDKKKARSKTKEKSIL